MDTKPRAIVTNCILGGVGTRVDGGLGLRFTTPELTSEEKVVFLNLQGKNCKMLLEPEEGAEEPPVQVKGELEHKTPGQRLRGVLFVWFKQLGLKGDFEDFYSQQLNLIIDKVKAKLEPEN